MFKTHAALILVNLIYAGNYTVAKIVMPVYIAPFGFIFLRVMCALIFFILLYFSLIRERVHIKDWLRLAACGVFGVAANQLMFFKGLNITTPVNAALIMITTPVIVFLISFFLRSERMTVLKIAGLSLGAAGYFTVISGNNFSFSSTTVLGDFYVLLNACAYGIYLVLVKPLMKTYNPFTVVFYVFLFGFIIVFFAGYDEFRQIDWNTFNSTIWLSVGYVVFGTTIIAYLLNIFALRKVNASVVSIYIYLQPVFASLIAVLAEKDIINMQKAIAAVLIFSGVYLVTSSSPLDFLFSKNRNV